MAVSEIEKPPFTGNTMMFCFHMGQDCEDKVLQAYEVLKDGADKIALPGPCGYSTYQFKLVDKFGVYWCMFI